MNTSDIVLAYAIILIFAAVFFYSFIIAGKTHIAQNWDMYKCSPMITPFSTFICDADSPCKYTDPSGNIMARPAGIVFSECLQGSQSGQVKQLLKPIWSVVGTISDATSHMNTSMSLLGNFFNMFQRMFAGITNSIIGTIKNVMAGTKGASGNFSAGLEQSMTSFGLFGDMGSAAAGGVRSGWNAYPGAFIDAASKVGS